MTPAPWLSEPEVLHMVRVTHWPDGSLFPEGQGRDFSKFHSGRNALRHVRVDGREVRYTYRMWDPYSAYGSCPLPNGHPAGAGRMIDNVHWVPLRQILDRMVAGLEELARECSVIWWDSAIQCFPYVAHRLKSLFRLCILNFGDDLPGSSDVKTFPVAPYFDALIHAMYVWDPASGKTVPMAYAERGLKDCRFLAWGPLNGRDYDDAGFGRKMARMRAGTLPVRLVWLGTSGASPVRRAVLSFAVLAFGDADKASGRVRFHGTGMGGWWPGPPSALYAESAFGLNVAESSLFNGRFADYCMSGTVQIAYDPHGELPHFGFQDGVHYVRWDGSPGGFLPAMGRLTKDPESMARMAEAARARFVEYRRQYDTIEVESGILIDYERQIREGRP